MDTHKIIMLGPSGSGKTAFLASMWNKLSIGRPELGFQLDIVDEYETSNGPLKNTLGKIHEMNSNPRDSFAPATTFGQDATNLNGKAPTLGELNLLFECKINGPVNNKKYATARFQYLDYAGEYFDSDDPIVMASISKAIKDAHVLLGLIDGEKVLDMLEKDDYSWWNGSFRRVLGKMDEQNTNVHFVLSKWDLLQDKYTLEYIIERILEVEDFSDFILSRINTGHTVRLIPVSSFGKGFATLNERGEMQKVGRQVKPYNVEMPLSCVLPDLINTAKKNVEIKQRELEKSKNAPAQKSLLPEVWLYFKSAFNLGDTLFGRQLDVWITEPEKQKEQRRNREIAAQLKDVEDEMSAYRFTLDNFQRLNEKLTRELPCSNLTQYLKPKQV